MPPDISVNGISGWIAVTACMESTKMILVEDRIVYPRKGVIKAGSDADLVIFDPKKRLRIDHRELKTVSDWSPYQGLRLKGGPVMTISRGEVIVKNGRFVGRAGRGRFISRNRSLDVV